MGRVIHFRALILLSPRLVSEAHIVMSLDCPFVNDGLTWLLCIHQRTIEKWLRKELQAERRIRKERREQGLPEYEDQVQGSRVVGGDPAKAQLLNNGWAAGRLHSTLAGDDKEELYDWSSNRVLR